MLSEVEPVSRAGRPAQRGKALDRDGNFDITKIKHPERMRGQMIRHSVYGIGLVINSRSYILKQTKKTVVCWGVSFVDAPGGPQKFELEEEALVEAVKLFKDWEKSQRNAHEDEWD
jgi:hypothetical protein